MLHKIWEYFKKRPGLVLLILILTIITIVNIKPDFYLLGWDNFSSYFNLKTNIFRTFFATWREYRGLGVPSDSEVTDIFRQLFFLVLSPIVPQTMLDQLYLLLSLNVGVIAMYLLAGKIIKKNEDLSGFFAAFFYLFNLNTVSTFNFPMIMYINRFFSLPVVFLIFLSLLNNKTVSIKKYIFFIIIILFTSGTYLTATIFITVFLLLFLFGIFQGRLKRFLAILVLFIGLNAFWLLPFFNYTIQKTDIIRLAPNFIDANEAQLNKPASFYSLQKNLVLYPNFFDTKFNNLSLTQKQGFHLLADKFGDPSYKTILFVFPLFYILGSFFIFKNRDRELYWLPISIVVMLFLVLKEFSSLGFFYMFLNKLTPLFGVIFRFGDTKLHPIIAFSGSLAASYFIVVASRSDRLRKAVVQSVLIIACLSTVWVFRNYFNGNLVGFFMYNQIPKAYFDITQTINSDTGEFRVLHLPVDKDEYWKSYSWGMFGSSFIHYLINKPLIDKTFDPGSMENAQLNKGIFQIIDNSQSAANASGLNDKSHALYDLLRKSGIKYVIFDGTVTSQQYPRGISLWENFNSADFQALLVNMEKLGLMQTVSTYQINLMEYMNLYNKQFPLDKASLDYLQNNPSQTISLLQIKDINPKISFANYDSIVDTKGIHPFKKNDYKVNESDQIITLSSQIQSENNLYAVSIDQAKTNTQSMLEIDGRKQGNFYVFSFYQVYSPQINGIQFKNKIREIGYIQAISNLLRLQIDDNILSVPANLQATDTYVGSVVVPNGTVNISVLEKHDSQTLDLNRFSLTTNPNCYNDKLQDFSNKINKNNNELSIVSNNGSTCFWRDLQPSINPKTAHIEIQMDAVGSNDDLDEQYDLDFVNTTKPVLKKVITNLPKPNFLRICLKEYNVDNCFNNHQIINVDGTNHITIIPEKAIFGVNDLSILMSLKNDVYQKQMLTVKNMQLDSYYSVKTDDFNISVPNNILGTVDLNQNLNISFPPTNSTSTFISDGSSDGYYISNTPCLQNPSYRTYRQLNGKFVSYFENCDMVISRNLPFSSNNFYLWTVDYNLLSGKFPKFILDDGIDHYKDEYLSLYQGYPDIDGFKKFQNPEWFANRDETNKTLHNLSLQTAYTFISPQPDLQDQRNKNFTIHQDSENEAGIVFGSYKVLQLPDSWENLILAPVNSQNNYSPPSSYQVKKILPSLWQVNLSQASTGKSLLLFNEGFDKQWRLSVDAVHTKCNDYFNCFEIPSDSNSFYIFYAPEILSFLGWGITMLTVIFSIFLINR